MNKPSPNTMTVPSGYNLSTTGITYSLLSKFLECPRKFLYALNLWKPIRDTYVTRWGTLLHWALEQFYSGAAKPVTTIIDVSKFLTQYPHHDTIRRELSADEQARWEVDVARAMAVIPAYCKIYEKDFTPGRFTHCEQIRERYLGKVLLRGKIDGVLTIQGGAKRVIEHKTRSMINEDAILEELTFDLQSFMYSYMVETRNVLYNIIRKPSHSPSKRNNETLPAFATRLHGEILKEPTHFFKRFEITWSHKDFAFIMGELNEVLGDLERRLLRGAPPYCTIFPRNHMACRGRYGSCEYLRACASNSFTDYIQRDELFPELKDEKGGQ